MENNTIKRKVYSLVEETHITREYYENDLCYQLFTDFEKVKAAFNEVIWTETDSEYEEIVIDPDKLSFSWEKYDGEDYVRIWVDEFELEFEF